MKYFIGVQVPKEFKNRIEIIRAKFKFFSTEPHITLISPNLLLNDDLFIKDLIRTCKEFGKINIKLESLDNFNNKVLYINVVSPKLIELHYKIHQNLNLEKDTNKFVPHLTIAKHRHNRPINIDRIKTYADLTLHPYEYNVKSIVVYQQPKEKAIYIPYMKIPL